MAYWSLSSIPELQHLPVRARRELLRRAVPMRTRVIMVVNPLLRGMIAQLIVVLLIAVTLGANRQEILVVAGLATIILVSLVSYLLQVRRIRGHIRREIIEQLAGERPPFCFGCGFDLRGTDAEQCPECGAPTVLPPKSSSA
ncbi:MAG: hypothetical protein ACYTGC_05045 [Planctomycetota bacterium]|jgi:hypothetical protein